jgi:hypothetical protein
VDVFIWGGKDVAMLGLLKEATLVGSQSMRSGMHCEQIQGPMDQRKYEMPHSQYSLLLFAIILALMVSLPQEEGVWYSRLTYMERFAADDVHHFVNAMRLQLSEYLCGEKKYVGLRSH